MTNAITLSRTSLDRLNSLLATGITTDCNDTRRDMLCEAHRLLNPGDWRTATPEENAANEPDGLIEQIKQSKLSAEAEAYTAGQMTLQRMMAEVPDYELLCRITEQAKEFYDEEDFSLTEIADNEFSNDLDFYPVALRGTFLDGFFSEGQRVYSEVSK
jgi:hypothetical protein